MAADLADRVQFIDENDGGRPLSRLLKHITNASRADADKQFHKIRTRQTEERHTGFPGNSFRQQSLAGSRWANEQHTAWNSASQCLILGRISQKLHDLTQFFDSFVDSCDIVEGDAQFFLNVKLASTATESDGGTGSTHPSHHNEQESNDQGGRQAKDDKITPQRFVFVLIRNLCCIQNLRQFGLIVTMHADE